MVFCIGVVIACIAIVSFIVFIELDCVIFLFHLKNKSKNKAYETKPFFNFCDSTQFIITIAICIFTG
ncbi:MAG: hypothetical protein MI739_03455, partial [Bacteroidales bacterium]|nr:hypothetical protein [Bacteroidales bacterium]